MERVIVRMTKAEKRLVASRARKAKLGIGAYIRRQVLGDGRNEEAVLSALAQDLKASNASAVRALDDVLARFDVRERQRGKREASAKHRAEKEFAELAKAMRS